MSVNPHEPTGSRALDAVGARRLDDPAPTVTPISDVDPVLLHMMASAIRYAPRDGVVRLKLMDVTSTGTREGFILVDVEEARRALGMKD